MRVDKSGLCTGNWFSSRVSFLNIFIVTKGLWQSVHQCVVAGTIQLYPHLSLMGLPNQMA